MTLYNLTKWPKEPPLEIQFNPTQFKERLSVAYGRPQIIGQSHQEMQYLGTTNIVVPMQFFFLSRDPETHKLGLSSKNFLYSLCYPVKTAESIVSGAPPRVLVVWPNTLSLTCKITQLEINNQRFNIHGEVTQFTANCTFEEIRELRWTSEDARALGVRRTAEKPGGNR